MDPDARTSFYLQVEENRKRDALKMLDELINAEMPREEELDASVTDNCDLLAQLGSEDFPLDLEHVEPYLRSMTARPGVRKLAETASRLTSLLLLMPLLIVRHFGARGNYFQRLKGNEYE